MSLCQITGSYGPYLCKARAKDKFQKALFTYHPKNPSMYQRLLEHLRLWADLRFPAQMMTLYVYA